MTEMDTLIDNQATGTNPRLAKQKSSSGLFNDRGRGSALGLNSGMRGFASNNDPSNPFHFGKPSKLMMSKSGAGEMFRS